MTVNLRSLKYPSSLILISVFLGGCFESDYTKLVKSELAKGVRKDSVLLGIRLGNTRNEFNGKCYDLNKQQLITQGEGFSIQYLFTDSVVHQQPTPMKLLFVPAFDDKEVITNIDLKFSYNGWSPWNDQLQADSLKSKVMALMMHWYGGNQFITTDVDDHPVTVKLDGNRRILVLIFDEQSVVVRVQDILHPKFKHSITSGQKK